MKKTISALAFILIFVSLAFGGAQLFNETIDIGSITDGMFPYMRPNKLGLGDSPLSTDGTDVTCTGAFGATSLTITGSVIPGQETVTCVGDACSEDITIQTHFVVSDGGADSNADSLTLNNGSTAGQETTFIYKTSTDVGDTIVIDTVQQVGWTSFTMNSVGDSVTFIWDGTNWTIKSVYTGTYIQIE